MLALERPLTAAGTFNVTDEVPVTWAAFTDDLAGGSAAPPVRLEPALPARDRDRLLATEQGYRLLRGATGLRTAPLLSRQAVQVLGRDQSFSAARARELLGWEPRVGYRDGLESTLGWLRRRPRRAEAPPAELDATGAGP